MERTQRRDELGIYLQGLIQVSAAALKREQGIRSRMLNLSRSGLRRLRQVVDEQSRYCGPELGNFVDWMESFFGSPDLRQWPLYPRICLIVG